MTYYVRVWFDWQGVEVWDDIGPLDHYFAEAT